MRLLHRDHTRNPIPFFLSNNLTTAMLKSNNQASENIDYSQFDFRLFFYPIPGVPMSRFTCENRDRHNSLSICRDYFLSHLRLSSLENCISEFVSLVVQLLKPTSEFPHTMRSLIQMEAGGCDLYTRFIPCMDIIVSVDIMKRTSVRKSDWKAS